MAILMTGLLFTFQISHSNIPAFLINKQAIRFLQLKTQMLPRSVGRFPGMLCSARSAKSFPQL